MVSFVLAMVEMVGVIVMVNIAHDDNDYLMIGISSSMSRMSGKYPPLSSEAVPT